VKTSTQPDKRGFKGTEKRVEMAFSLKNERKRRVYGYSTNRGELGEPIRQGKKRTNFERENKGVTT